MCRPEMAVAIARGAPAGLVAIVSAIDRGEIEVDVPVDVGAIKLIGGRVQTRRSRLKMGTESVNRDRIGIWLFALVATLIAQPSMSAGEWDGDGVIEAGEDETAELARAAQNPVANLYSLPFQNNTNFNWGLGPVEETQNVLNIQPVLPFEVTDDWNIITRTILPVVSQPGPVPGVGRKNGLGDLTFTAFASPSNPDLWPLGKLLWGLGPVVLAPTATDDRLGFDKWGLGPSLVVLAMPGRWVVGALANNIWSVGGSGDQDVNSFLAQPFANYNLEDGWYLVSAPIITANWEASSGNKWTVPVGGGGGKIFRVGKLPPMNFSVQAYYNAARPDVVGAWTLRTQLQVMFPKRR